MLSIGIDFSFLHPQISTGTSKISVTKINTQKNHDSTTDKLNSRADIQCHKIEEGRVNYDN